MAIGRRQERFAIRSSQEEHRPVQSSHDVAPRHDPLASVPLLTAQGSLSLAQHDLFAAGSLRAC